MVLALQSNLKATVTTWVVASSTRPPSPHSHTVASIVESVFIDKMSLPLQFSLSPPTKIAALPRFFSSIAPPFLPSYRRVSVHRNFTKSRFLTFKAAEEIKESTERETVEEQEPVASDEVGESKVELSELGAEIKKAMQERKEEAQGNILSGVAEEIREIEWPAFGKVLATTGVVLGVIAGSSVVLLTVNAVLAELSDRVFSGRGVQDFFS